MGKGKSLSVGIAFATLVAISMTDSIAAAQDISKLPAAPRVQTFDGAGVDLRSGEFRARGTTISVGEKENPALALVSIPLTRSSNLGTPQYSKIERGCDYRYTDIGGIYRCNGLVGVYTLGHETFVIAHSSAAPFEPHHLNDGSLVVDGPEVISVHRSDGSVWTFRKRTDIIGWPQFAPIEMGNLINIVYPDGSALEYDAGGVMSTLGYRWQYQTLDGRSLVNLSTAFCAVGAAQCDGLEVSGRSDTIGKTTTQSQGNIPQARNVQITSGEGVRIELTQALVGATSPIHTGSEESAYCGGMHAFRTLSLKDHAGTWTYSYTSDWMGGGQHPYCRVTETKSVDPNGGTTVVSGVPGQIKITDPLGRITQHATEIWFGPSYSNYDRTEGNLINSTIYPEGNRVDYEYIGRNLSRVTETPKPGGGVTRVTFQAGYPGDCSVGTMKVCNKPLYTIDANGGQTDYSYHAPSGMMETKTEPAGANGVRLQTRYAYQQLEARILNSAGQLTPTGRPIWKLVSVSECRNHASCVNTADETITSFTYNDNLLPITETVRVGDNSIAAVTTTKTYDAVGNVVATDGPLPGTADTTYFVYNLYRELVAKISPDPDGSGPLPRAVERSVYNADGKPIRVETGMAHAIDASDFVLSRFKKMTYDATGLLTKVEEVLP